MFEVHKIPQFEENMKQPPKGKINVAENINPNNHRVQENQQQLHNPSQYPYNRYGCSTSGLILGLRPTNERRRCFVNDVFHWLESKSRLSPSLEKET